MQFIEELVEYFSELITEEQKSAVERLFGLGAQPKAVRGENDDTDDLDDLDEYDEYDKYDEYEFPAPDRKHGHASGKRRPLRHPAITAAGLVDAFRKLAKMNWKSVPVAHRIFLELAEAHDPGHFVRRGRASDWRRFTAAVSCLKGLDEDALADVIRRRLEQERNSGAGSGSLFYDWFLAWQDGGFTWLANTFCRCRVDGVAGKAALAALRGITCPETTAPPRGTNVFRSFLDDPELVGIFDYYRVQRKLEYIQTQTVEEAARRLKNGYY